MASPFPRPLGRSFTSAGRGQRIRLAGVAGIIAILSALLPATTLGTGPQTFTVDSTADTSGNCAVPTQCTLRQAIDDANLTVDADTILFAIGTGLQTIVLDSELPGISQPLTIDGTSQPGYDADDPTPMIELNGESVDVYRGLQLFTNDSEIRGLILNRFQYEAIGIHGDGNRLVGNYVGLDQSGTSIYPDRRSWPAGIMVTGSNNSIGGTELAQRNVVTGNISGIEFEYNGSNNVVRGNYVGTDVTGTIALGNQYHGISINIAGATNDVIGGAGAGERNVVVGATDSGGSGISVGGDGNTILGNLIGVSATGAAFADKQGGNGVVLNGAGNTFGGMAPGAGNVVAGFNYWGFAVSGASNQIVGNFIGTDASGMVADGNGYAGMLLQSSGNLVRSNVISGNGGQDGWGYGLLIDGPGASGNLLQANMIGTAADGLAPLGNANQGVALGNQANGNVIGGTNPGDGNTIAFNADTGVYVSDAGGPCCSLGNRILGNSIHSNVYAPNPASPALGIDLSDRGPSANDAGDGDVASNNLQNYPVVGAVTASAGSTTIDGTLSTTPAHNFRVELFLSSECDPTGYGEGETFLGFVNVTTDGVGQATFTTSVPGSITALDGFVTATATDTAADATSEFSHCNTWPSTQSGSVPAGGTLSTGTTTSTDTIATSVTTPVGGTVSITEGPATTTTPSGFSLLGVQVDITAPASDTSNPLEVTFLLDPYLTIGMALEDIHVFRTEGTTTTDVLNCVATNPINPDPCISDRLYDGDTGAFRLTVLTSHASAWNLGLAGFVPPPTGKAVVMGPQAMEGDLKLAMGSTLKVGYDFKIAGNHVAQTVSFVEVHADFAYTCVAGPSTPKKVKPVGSGTLSVPVPNAAILDAANSPAWLPSAKQGDPSVYQGSLVLANDLCTANGLVRLHDGGTFFFRIASNGNHEKVSVRWHYSAAGSAGGWSASVGVTPN